MVWFCQVWEISRETDSGVSSLDKPSYLSRTYNYKTSPAAFVLPVSDAGATAKAGQRLCI